MNKYFDRIYLLNLFRRKDRLKKSQSKLDSHNIDYEIFHGCDGSVISHVWEKFSNSNFTNPSYLACSISHLSIYQDALKNGYEKILIIEDDCLINKNIDQIFGDLFIPHWNDLFYLGYIPLTEDCSMWNYNIFGMNSENKIVDKIFNPRNLWGLFSYGISNSLMEEMIDIYNKEFPMEIDRYFVQKIQPRGNSIAISPQLFCCDDVYSDNLGFSPPNMILKSIDTRFASIGDYI